jgi:hypothetical protein
MQAANTAFDEGFSRNISARLGKSNERVIGRRLEFVIAASLFLSGCCLLPAQEVSPNALWRGSRPDTAEITRVSDHGVKSIVDLEWAHDDLPTILRAGFSDEVTHNIQYFRVKDF